MLLIEKSEINEIISGNIISFLKAFAVVACCFTYIYLILHLAPETKDPKLIIAEDFYYNIYDDQNFNRIDEFCLKYEQCGELETNYEYDHWDDRQKLEDLSVLISGIKIEINENGTIAVDGKKHSFGDFTVGTQIFFYYLYSIIFTIALIISYFVILEQYCLIGAKDNTPPHSKFKKIRYMNFYFILSVLLFFISCYLNKEYLIINEYDYYDNVDSMFFKNIVLYYTVSFSFVGLLVYSILFDIDNKIKENIKNEISE